MTVTLANYRDDPMYPRIVQAVHQILVASKYVAPIDVIARMGLLTKLQVEDWRRGRVPFLERVVGCNLARLSRLLRILRFHAHDLKLKPSLTVYMRHGKGPEARLRFTKTGERPIETAYSTHFVWPGKGPFHYPGCKEPLTPELCEVGTFLIVPGYLNSGPGHWQSIWQSEYPRFRRVSHESWEFPEPTKWSDDLRTSVRKARRPTILVAHSLGCLTVARWAVHNEGRVVGALLVAPPDVGRETAPSAVRGFSPLKTDHLGFPSVLVASRTDPYAPFEYSESLAKAWGSELIDAGESGHLNADSCLGEWKQGKDLLRRLVSSVNMRWGEYRGDGRDLTGAVVTPPR